MLNENKSKSRRCVACQKTIDQQATKCEYCQSYQVRWKNRLKYWSEIATLIGLIFSAIVFSANQLIDYIDRTSGALLEILEMDSHGNLTVANNDNKNVFLKRLFIGRADRELNLTYDIQKYLRAESVFTYSLIDELKRWGPWMNEYDSYTGPFQIGLGKESVEGLLQNRHAKYKISFVGKNVFNNLNTPSTLKDDYFNNCTSFLEYYTNGRYFRHEIPCFALARAKKQKI
ncbi:MAG: hypothetical protein AB2733_13030 [Candidatus Thiodiazotropha taylori]